MDEKDIKVIENTLTELLSKSLDGMKGDLDTLVNAKFQKLLEENKLTANDLAKGRLPVVAQGEEKFASIGGFIKSVFKKDIAALTKGMTEGTDSEGGFLVPDEFYAEVMRLAKDYGLAMKFATKFNMGSDTLNVPVESTSVTSYWPGEATAITASTPVLANAALQAKTLAGITVTSNELLADSKVDTTKYLMGIFAESFAGEIDNQAFNGTGSPFTGILSDAGVNVVTMATGQETFAETKLTDLRDLISLVPTICLPTSAYFMHPLTWGTIQKIQEGSQTIAVMQAQPVNIGYGADQVGLLKPAGMLWGYPVFLSDKIVSTTAISTKFVVFGSLSKGLFIGDRQKMTLDTSNQSTVGGVSLFETNQSAVRVTQRVAVKVALPKAFAVLKTAAS
jgi:HK97 family phage major capsid protein